ncbi:MAG: N-acetylneuraminate synthase family protein [Gammaproteobacteria bacterium]|nr:N-acetylneuraminate synthase family protein [Gammaproteobacteria bacterium]
MDNGEKLFTDLFVLEMANNHWGEVNRGMAIISAFSRIVRYNNIKAAIKLQFRDVDAFIHSDFRERQDVKYIKKTLDTKLSRDDYETLVRAIRSSGCITMSTPFDDRSVDLCVELGIDIIKIASSDINDWILIEKIATIRKPVIVSTGGSSLKDIDDLVTFFSRRNIPLAINHCVSLYPSDDDELELNQIDFLVDRFPDTVIGFSSHEQNDWHSSVMLAYAKGARTFERHIDIDADGIPVSSYCTLPQQADTWFKAWKTAVLMCGASGNQMRIPKRREVEYLDQLVRGVYAKKDLKKGSILTLDNVYLAIPLQKGQISCRELMNGERLVSDLQKDSPIHIDDVDSPYAKNKTLQELIYDRGL